MSINKIPLYTDDNYSERVLLNDEYYTLTFSWNSLLEVWSMDIANDSETLLNGLCLYAGVELVNKYNLPFSNLYVVNTADTSKEITQDESGDTCFLILVDDDTLTEITEDDD